MPTAIPVSTKGSGTSLNVHGPKPVDAHYIRTRKDNTVALPPGLVGSPKVISEDAFEYKETSHKPSLNGEGNLEEHTNLEDKVEPIAIVGLSCRLPQDATSPEGFWEMMIKARSGLTDIPPDRFNVDAFYDDKVNGPGRMNVRGGHFIREDLAKFDAGFFSITPTEAASMDPQQRWLLESSYEALENAGIPMERALGSATSVFVGSFTRDYENLSSKDPELGNLYKATGTATSMLANRLSWFYDFSGPSLVLDTACSSSLTALHLACQSIRSRESSMALVCGCNLIISPEVFASMTDLHFLSPDSKCYSFDHRANGYARGEGLGVVVLKPLSDAIHAGDTIRAVIRATGANQDGRTPGITQPSTQAQEAMIRRTYHDAGLSMATTQYFEAHGTGTALGDPIEAKAIYNAFKDERPRSDPLLVGAVKSNIGHLEGASGIAGLIKSVMVLEKGVIPPNIWFEKPNPMIPFEEWNLAFPTKPVPWPKSGLRRASVSSFGFGGANAHVVLDDAYNYQRLRFLRGRHRTRQLPPTTRQLEISNSQCSPKNLDVCSISVPKEKVGEIQQPQILVWSAKDEDGLHRWESLYKDYLQDLRVEDSDDFLQDLAHTLVKHRSLLPLRSFMVAKSIVDLKSGLKLTQPIRAIKSPKVAFIFTGQGAQWQKMGQELLEYPVYRESLVSAERYLYGLGCPWSLLGELYGINNDSRLDDPLYSQPICTALQIALVDLLAHLGVLPSAVIGHSSGEIAAAYCVGGLSRDSALKVAYYRGLATGSIKDTTSQPTTMMSVGLSAEEVKSYIRQDMHGSADEHAYVGCINSPRNVTLSGSHAKLERLHDQLVTQGIFCQMLKVNVAYHTVHMEQAASVYRSLIQNIQAEDRCGQTAMYSSVTGEHIDAISCAQPDYWVRNMVSPVQFLKAVSCICAQPSKRIGNSRINRRALMVVDHALELGPHSTLRGPLKDIFEKFERSKSIGYNSLLRRSESGVVTALEAVGALHCIGYPVDLSKANIRSGDQRLPQMLTDLPSYPFNHAKMFWLESRKSKSYRFRGFPYHALLGTRDSDWNPWEAKWQNRISTPSHPFVKDHKVNGVEAYPAAGMLVMAIEAMKQFNWGRKCTRYHVKEATFHRALLVPSSSEGVEVQFLLVPAGSAQHRSVWANFKLYAYENEQWDEVCRGAISVDFEEHDSSTQTKSLANDGELHLEVQGYRSIFDQGQRECKMAMTTKRLYEIFAQHGLQYGPSFQILEAVRFDEDGDAIAALRPQEWQSEGQQSKVQSHIIHPTTLDAVFQIAFPALTRGGKHLIPTMVPTRIYKLWLAESAVVPCCSKDIKVFAHGKFMGFRSADVSIIAVGKNNEPFINVQMEMTFVAGPETLPSNHTDRFQRFYNLEWKPDLEMLNNSQIGEYAMSAHAMPPVDQSTSNKKEIACMLLMRTLIQNVRAEDLADLPHIRKYYEWMRYQCSTRSEDLSESDCRSSHAVRGDGHNAEELFRQLESLDTEGKLIARVARNLKLILTGKMDALELLFGDDLLQEYYRDAHDAPYILKTLRTYVDTMAHRHPGMKILEIGAGTGGATAYIVDNAEGQTRFSEYMFTDVSPSFFESAKDQFNNERMLFKTLDIEKDPLEQGFEASSYDLIIASNVLHATSKLGNTLQNTRKLLRPGGKLALFEVVNPEKVRVSFIFGLLAGWWMSTEEHRRWGPIMPPEQWDSHLMESGYSGVDMILSNREDPQQPLCSALVSTVPLPQQTELDRRDLIVIRDEDSPLQNAIALQVDMYLQSQGHTQFRILSPGDLTELQMKQNHYILLTGLERPYIDNVDKDSLLNLQKLSTAARTLLWLTHTEPHAESNPLAGATLGLSRCICQENESLKSITLNIETLEPNTVASHIIKVLQQYSLNQSVEYEPELAEKAGRLCITRVMKAKRITDHVSERTKPKLPENRPIGEENGKLLRLTIGSVGLLDSLHFKEDPGFHQDLPADEIEVRTEAVGVNFRDVLVALGQVSSDYFGNECAGYVTKVGKSASSEFKVGDRVVCALSDAFRTRIRCPASVACHIPDHLDFATAAAMPIAFCTAEYCLSKWACLEADETILIHSAAGGFGQAAVQLAKLRGAEIFVTVGTDEKRDFMKDAYGIPEDHIFSSRTLSFAKGVLRMTGNRGVDVILNSLSGEGLQRSWDCISPFGRFIEVGKKDIYAGGSSAAGGLPMRPFAKNVMFASVDLSLIIDTKPSVLAGLMHRVITMAATKQIFAPKPLRTFKASEIESAFRYMQSGKQSGKLVIEFNDEDVVSVVPSPKTTYPFDPSATYLVAGGLGGLGRSLCRWMVSRNVRHLILLSRSSTYNHETVIFLEELRARGVNVATPPCDVSDAGRLREILDYHANRMPPIKGCIQASMVLDNAMFRNMSFEQFERALKPKVQGSYNLHQLLPKGMDFFVLLSSYAGIIGSPGQSNYACGNTYQDALARHRVAHGEKAVALDLGVIESVGIVSEHADVAGFLQSTGHEGLAENELHALLEYYCDPDLPIQSELESQVIASLELPSTLRAKSLVDLPWMSMPLFRQLWQIQTTVSKGEVAGGDDAADQAASLEQQLAAAQNLDEASEAILEMMRARLSRMLAIEPSGIDVGKPLHSYGVDSLVAIELRNWFAKAVGSDVAVFEILGNGSMATLAGAAAEKSKYVSKEVQKDG